MNRFVPAAVVTVLAFAAGMSALGSGLDRMGAASPGLAATLPAATHAVRRDPMDATAASALGLARLSQRDGAGAAAAFRVAAGLGWRDKQTQLYWMAVATNLGDFPLAAQRADALLRQDGNLREQPLLLALLERLPQGRKALAARLALRPAWSGDYWNKLHLLKPEQLSDRARVLDEPALRPAKMQCGDVRTMVSSLIAAGAAAKGRAIFDQYCGRQGATLLADGGFERARLADASPFGWQFTGVGGLDIRLETLAGGGGQAVVVDTALPMRQVFASQALQLPPGRYRVSWRVGGEQKSRIVARLACQQGSGKFLAAALALVELDSSCPLQWLDLAIDPGEGAVTIDDVKVAAVR